jgi:signal transduction histidine kinase
MICSRCPGNALELVRSDTWANGLAQAQRIAGVVLGLAALTLVARRWARASTVERRHFAPVAWAGGAVLIAMMVSVANDAAHHPLGAAPKQALFIVLAALPVAGLIALVQRRLARAAVAGLVVELGERPAPTDLRQALARALRDPSLELAYWFAAAGRYVDSEGRPVDPAPGPGRAATVVERAGQRIAVLVHDHALGDNPELLDSVCAAAALALENERLQAELRARLADLQASRARLVEATGAERRRIERDLHDGTQQRLVSVAMSLGLADAKLPAEPGSAKPIIREARAALAAALKELRELTQGIYPTILTERGLEAALADLRDRSPLPLVLSNAVGERVAAPAEAAAYFVVSEALANTVKHADASEVHVSATYGDHLLVVEVADDGVGGATTYPGTGLRGLMDRVEALGGRVTVSSPAGHGTVVRAEVPCE